MSQNICEHKYPNNSWNLDETGAAVRVCEKCGSIQKFENGNDFQGQILKQQEATEFLNKFRQFDKNDHNIIQYLWLMLDNYYMYLNDDGVSLLIDKMEEIKQSDIIDEKNIAYIKYLSNYMKEKNFKIFWDIFEDFENFNLRQFLTEEKEVGFHR